LCVSVRVRACARVRVCVCGRGGMMMGGRGRGGRPPSPISRPPAPPPPRPGDTGWSAHPPWVQARHLLPTREGCRGALQDREGGARGAPSEGAFAGGGGPLSKREGRPPRGGTPQSPRRSPTPGAKPSPADAPNECVFGPRRPVPVGGRPAFATKKPIAPLPSSFPSQHPLHALLPLHAVNSRELAMEISVTSLGSSQILR